MLSSDYAGKPITRSMGMPEVNRINSTVLGFVGPKARRYTAEHVERFVV